MNLQKISYAGIEATVEVRNPLDHIEKHWLLDAFYEANSIGILNHIFLEYQDCKVFYDIGASIGNHTLFFSEIMGADFVLAVEPSPESFDHLSANIKLNQNHLIRAHNAALGNKGAWGHTELYGKCNTDPDCPHSPNVGMTKFVEGEGDVAMLTLDALVRDTNAPPPDFIKIDAEGWEKEIILGAKNTIDQFRPVVSIEVEPIDKLEYFDGLMRYHGYKRKNIQLNHTPTFIWEP